ncbi:MAG: hypothetical protein IKM13_02160 [Clostridia bacterium]|nr:hypothetical protein [Clostridia bacterium]
MYQLSLSNMTIALEVSKGTISSLTIHGKERLASSTPLFRLGLRDKAGNLTRLSAFDAKHVTETCHGGIYTDFTGFPGLSLEVTLKGNVDEAEWYVTADPGCNEHLVEWVDFPLVNLPKLHGDDPAGCGGKILYPYNEGAMVESMAVRNKHFPHREPEYPSLGAYSVFPNMICSQLLAYIFPDAALYLGAHDPARGVKGIDFYEESDGITMEFRLYCGADYGEVYRSDFPMVWSVVDGCWEAAAERYRAWNDRNLPPRAKKITENDTLPAWYADSPLVVSYPVRGIHDTDIMNPNRLFPYTNALPLLRDIRGKIDHRLMVLLMHWEGTAPWAPPYVWPPYGDPDNFVEFLRTLHDEGDVLGVYCSGFGYSMKSNLVDDYDRSADYTARGLQDAMCAAPDESIGISRICTAQRVGYDICPASQMGRELLREAYYPLLQSGVDYAQILDQNHGGGQYFCYSRNHGHAPSPGKWMTENMQNMLTEWNQVAGKTLLGCESAAGEAFMGNLLFSDNRYELNYALGYPVPLYAYLYHEYLRNFMGNQVACSFDSTQDTLRYRLAYSFAIGDAMTLVLTPGGDLMSSWGTRDFDHAPNKEKALGMISNLTRFYREEAKPYLYAGRMIQALPVECETVTYTAAGRPLPLPEVIATAWQAEDGSQAQILVNPGDNAVTCRMAEKAYTIPAGDAILVPLV